MHEALTVLYWVEFNIEPELTVKIIGHQWYWEYEYLDFYFWTSYFNKPELPINFSKITVESYIVPESALKPGIIRLLEVDNRAVFPVILFIRGLVTSADVIHRWSLPSVGVKVDAVPGRVNQAIFHFLEVGVYFGICSEICGAGHSKIPIVVEVVPIDIFILWIIHISFFFV